MLCLRKPLNCKIMLKFLSTYINPYFLDLCLFLVRIFTGLSMLTHGTPKLAKLSADGPMNFGDPLNIGPYPSLLLTIFSEVVCSLFIIVGLGTRFAVLPLMVTMLVAAFVVHKADGYAKQELAVLYLLIYFTLFILGSGKYSVDRLIEKKTRS
jgi:putative oxidoreductase